MVSAVFRLTVDVVPESVFFTTITEPAAAFSGSVIVVVPLTSTKSPGDAS